MKQADNQKKKQSEMLVKLEELLKEEGKLQTDVSLQDLYDRLYKSLYAMRDFSVDFEVQNSKGLKGRMLSLYRKLWRIGASPYIRYNNQFHAVLINTIFMQNAILKQLEAKIESKADKE